MKILIIYHTKTGHTLEAINPFIEKIESRGDKAKLVSAKDFRSNMLENCDSFLVGTPCWAGSSGVIGVATPIVSALKKIPENALKGILCGGIAIHAKYGGETTLSHLKKILMQKGCENFKQGPVVKAGTLMSLFKGPSVSKTDEERIKNYADTFQ